MTRSEQTGGIDAGALPERVEYTTLGEIAVDVFRGADIKRNEVTEKGIPCVCASMSFLRKSGRLRGKMEYMRWLREPIWMITEIIGRDFWQ